MYNFLGYKNVIEVYTGGASKVFRAIRERDNISVIIKVLNYEYPNPEMVSRFKNEYLIQNSFSKVNENIAIVKAFSLEKLDNTLAIVMEDFNYNSLDKYLRTNPRLGIEEALSIMINITKAVGEIHSYNILHKDLNPSNILYNPVAKEIKIIDFGSATKLTSGKINFRIPSEIEGTLSYISPEQTGRMNRNIDYRTDFYMLGVTFYQLMTGKLPFSSKEPLELVYSHIAEIPKSMREIRDDIPEMINEIVLKLLSKEAENRYQTTNGLISDLEESLIQYTNSGKIVRFKPGKKDYYGNFQLPQKLYGRENEIEELIKTFENIGKEGTLVLIEGAAGIGKTALVQELYKPLTKQRGYFIAGKYDQFHRNIPYSGFIQAFRRIIKQLLSESEEIIENWRIKLLENLGSNGQILIDVIPEIEVIIGQQEEVPELLPLEAQNRFRLVFQNFIQVFALPEHPLVIFLDDIQWCDSASLNLLEYLMSSQERKNLCIIGSFRGNESENNQSMQITFNEIEKKGVLVYRFLIKELDILSISKMLGDILYCSTDSVLEFAKLIKEKTGGNPFFIIEFLKALHNEKKLYFKEDDGSYIWKWDIEEVKQMNISENVVEFLINRIKSMSYTLQKIMQWASCIGNKFDFQMLLHLADIKGEILIKELFSAISEGLIISNDENSKIVSSFFDSVNLNEFNLEFRFSHDRIQQAFYSTISKQIIAEMHFKIGKWFLVSNENKQCESRIFDIVQNINTGISQCSEGEYQKYLDEIELNKVKLIELNISAGKEALTAIAYDSALNYANFGFILLGEKKWENNYEFAKELSMIALHATYLESHFSEMDKIADEILENVNELLERIKVYEMLIQSLALQGKVIEALQLAISVLEMLNINLPKNPGEAEIGAAFQEVFAVMGDHSVESLLDLPEMRDSESLAAMHIMYAMATACYIVAPSLFPIIVLKQVVLSVKYGNTLVSTMGYTFYGLLSCAVLGDIDKGYRFGQLAIKLVNKMNGRKYEGMINHLVAIFTKHWKESVRSIIPILHDSYKKCLENGDLLYAGNSAYQASYFSFDAGVELNELSKMMAIYNKALYNRGQYSTLDWLKIYEQTVENLLGKSKNPLVLTGSIAIEEELEESIVKTNNRSGLCMFWLNKAILNFLMGDKNLASEYSDKAQQYIDSALGTPIVPMFLFYHTVIKLQIYSAVPDDKQLQLIKEIDENIGKLKIWIASGASYGHRAYLLEAERSRVMGDFINAREYYDLAVELAEKNEYVNELSIIYELAGRYYILRGKIRMALFYIKEAHFNYRRWGAIVKTNALETEFPELKNSKVVSEDLVNKINSTGSFHEKTGRFLDLSSVLKASQALSEEIVFSRLIEKLMTVLAENAGAQRGFLLLIEDSKLMVNAQIEEGLNIVGVLQNKEIVYYEKQLAVSVINYVARTHKVVILSDASSSDSFTTDEYILNNKPKSVICFPIISRRRLTGIVYFENNLVTNGFTPERVEVLSSLASQASISLENAKLYSEQEQLVEKRTLELMNTNNALRESEARFTAFMDYLPAAVFIKDVDGMTWYCNKYFEDNVKREWRGKTSKELFTEEEFRVMEEDDRKTLEKGIQEREETVKNFNNMPRIFHTTKFAIKRENKPVLLGGISIDITERKRMEAELKRMAAIDYLTECFNRRHFFMLAEKEFERIVRYDRELSVIMIDIDYFKAINDTYGHIIGDRVLKEVAQSIQNSIRQIDVLGRYGGEEFIVMAPETKEEEVKILAERIRSNIEKLSIETVKGRIAVTISLGISSVKMLTEDNFSFEMLVKLADVALYKAKHCGRNRVC